MQRPAAPVGTGQGSEIAGEMLAALRQPSPDAETLSEQLRTRWSLSPEEADRLLFQIVADINLQLFPPITQLELILTEACNLRCRYCFEAEMLGSKSMSTAVGRKAIDLLLAYSSKERQLFVTFFGGEPTLRLEAMEDIARYARRQTALDGKEINFNMTTNGTLLTEPVIAVLAEHRINALLSLDGLAAAHDRFRVNRRGKGSFETAVRGLRLLKVVQPWIAAKMTVMPENAATLCADVRGLHDLGVNQFIIGNATGLSWSRADILTFAEQWRRLHRWYRGQCSDDLLIEDFEKAEPAKDYFGCQAARSSLSVSIEGVLSPCSKMLALDRKRPLAKLGDVRYGLTHLGNRMDLVSAERVRDAWAALGRPGPYRGGCFAENHEESGDLFRPSLQEHRFTSLRAAALNADAQELDRNGAARR